MRRKNEQALVAFETELSTFLSSDLNSALFNRELITSQSIGYRTEVKRALAKHRFRVFEFESSTLSARKFIAEILNAGNHGAPVEAKFKNLCEHIENNPKATIIIYRCSELSLSALQVIARLNRYLAENSSEWKLLLFGRTHEMPDLCVSQLNADYIHEGDQIPATTPGFKSSARLYSPYLAASIILALAFYFGKDFSSTATENETILAISLEDHQVQLDTSYASDLPKWEQRVTEFEAAMRQFEDRASKGVQRPRTLVPSEPISLMTTELIAALEGNQLNRVIQLLDQGININAVSENQETALILATMNDDIDTVTWLLKHGASVNLTDAADRSALYYAAVQGNLSIAEQLLANGAQLQSSSRLNKTPLMAAVHNNHLELARLLIDAGSDVNQQDHSGWSALFYAVWNENETMTRLLTNAGATIGIKDRDGYTVADIAKAKRAEPLLHLIEAG